MEQVRFVVSSVARFARPLASSGSPMMIREERGIRPETGLSNRSEKPCAGRLLYHQCQG